jgi:hypothetical protein
MIVILENGKQIRGDGIRSAVYRSDLAPIPATLEIEIRDDNDIRRFIVEGKTIEANGDRFRIVKSNLVTDRESQGKRGISFTHVIGLLESCHTAAFVRQKAIIKENASLAEIYRAAGASIRAIDADFPVPRFYCQIGQAPTFPIAQILQEEGGVVRWKSGKMRFFRNQDLFRQKPVMTLPDNADENVVSGFQERHEIPWFYSTAPDGSFVHGNRTKSRSAGYSPHKNSLRLHNMTRCLVRQKISKIHFSGRLAAGDLIDISGSKALVITTAAHIWQSGTDGLVGTGQYTRLWLSGLQA